MRSTTCTTSRRQGHPFGAPADPGWLRPDHAFGSFEIALHQVFEQPMAPDWNAYCDKVASRAFSDLAAISDAEFEDGVALMRREHRAGPVSQPIDLFVFTKKGA
jgi:hypothetical protein